MDDARVEGLTREALQIDDRERIQSNMEFLRRASLPVLFRLRDAAKIMEDCGYVLEPLEASEMFEYVIKQRR